MAEVDSSIKPGGLVTSQDRKLLPGHGRVHLGMQSLEDLGELGLALEPDAGQVAGSDAAVRDDRVVGEPAGGLELARVRLVAAEVQGRCDVEGELVPAVRDAAAG